MLSYATADNITQSGFLPIKPEEDSSSSDPDLPQGQDFDVILSDVEDSPPRQLVRTKAVRPPPQARAHRGGKRPRSDMFAWNDHHAVSVESDEEGDEVDLGSFFKRHRVAERRQVDFYDTACIRPMLKLVYFTRQ